MEMDEVGVSDQVLEEDLLDYSHLVRREGERKKEKRDDQKMLRDRLWQQGVQLAPQST